MRDQTALDIERITSTPHISIVFALEHAPQLVYSGGRAGETARLFEWLEAQPAIMRLICQAQGIRDEAAGN
jgi:hypothetical protein